MTRTRTVNGEPVILCMFANNYDSAPAAVTAGQPVAEVANESASKTVASTAYDAIIADDLTNGNANVITILSTTHDAMNI